MVFEFRAQIKLIIANRFLLKFSIRHGNTVNQRSVPNRVKRSKIPKSEIINLASTRTQTVKTTERNRVRKRILGTKEDKGIRTITRIGRK